MPKILAKLNLTIDDKVGVIAGLIGGLFFIGSHFNFF